ncbi:hypothetical protein [Methylobacterium radiodurans]|uniref:Uncharacterized protein n=1 Tax=Methylobacterium radiodurans TaxID=2202828 RepID=A0A2U8VQH0_9HYPH|nr:hypothetical protein [Methylobacterium radiodurans]AWN35875.1 hypothetical protein DK427_09085 [Methylobacterium radiodurans]
MVSRSETQPPPANLLVDTPPASDNPTTAMLKADIDSGATGDKVEHYDVGMVQLGTCDEAAGTPPTPERIALARKTAAATRATRDAADPHGQRSWVMPAFAGFIVATAMVIGGAFWVGL